MTEQALAQATPQPSTILIVEDDPDIRLLLREVLDTAGYRTELVQTGADALDAVQRDSIDLVLLDLMLPDMDGHEVCRQIRESDMAELPVIILTAVSRPLSVIRGLSAANDYVTKPFAPDELKLRIEKLLRQRRKVLELTQSNAALHDMLQLMQRELEAAQVETQTESMLRQELLHNVTTHLQSLVAIVEAELRRLPPGIERESMHRIRGRVRGAALVYQVSEVLRTDPVPVGEIVRMTASALKSIYRPWKRVTVTVKGGDVDLPATIAAPLTMVINELITNCFKHAFPENRFGNINITYDSDDRTFSIDVADDGVGLSESPMGGNGRATVVQLVQNLNGNAAWEQADPGTRVRVRVPLTPTPAA